MAKHFIRCLTISALRLPLKPGHRTAETSLLSEPMLLLADGVCVLELGDVAVVNDANILTALSGIE